MAKRTSLTQALEHLNELVFLGTEFPDAVYKTSVKFDLTARDVEMLETLYDEDCTVAYVV
jgi:hypothetical protein